MFLVVEENEISMKAAGARARNARQIAGDEECEYFLFAVFGSFCSDYMNPGFADIVNGEETRTVIQI